MAMPSSLPVNDQTDTTPSPPRPPLLPLSYPFLFLSRLPQKPNREGEGKIFTSFITTTGALVVITATPTFCSEVNEAMQTYHTHI